MPKSVAFDPVFALAEGPLAFLPRGDAMSLPRVEEAQTMAQTPGASSRATACSISPRCSLDPQTTGYLGEMGAEVVKVEFAPSADISRGVPICVTGVVKTLIAKDNRSRRFFATQIAFHDSGKELSQIINHPMGALRFQLFRVSLPGHADYEPNPPCTPAWTPEMASSITTARSGPTPAFLLPSKRSRAPVCRRDLARRAHCRRHARRRDLQPWPPARPVWQF